MTRDELRGIIEGITDEQLKKILDINSSDIGKAKAFSQELKAKLEEAEAKLVESEKSVQSLTEGQCEAEKMKEKIDELQKVIDQKEEAAALAKSREELENRFMNAVGNVKFLNDFTKNGLFTEFLEAVKSEENIGRADEEIFSGLVEGRENLFLYEEDMPAVVASTMGSCGKLAENDVREIMGLLPR